MLKVYKMLCLMALISTALLLQACGSLGSNSYTSDYQAYANSFSAHQAKEQEREARILEGLAAAAASNDPETAKMAVLALAIRGANGGSQPVMLQAPVPQRTMSDRIFDGFLGGLPFLAQVFIEGYRTDQVIATTRANAQMHGATMSTFGVFSENFQAPAPNVTNTTTFQTTTNNTSTITNSYNPVTTDSTHTPTVVIPPVGP